MIPDHETATSLPLSALLAATSAENQKEKPGKHASNLLLRLYSATENLLRITASTLERAFFVVLVSGEIQP